MKNKPVKSLIGILAGAFLLLVITLDFKDIRLKVSQERLSRPFFAGEYKIFFKIGLVQGLIDQKKLPAARSLYLAIQPETGTYQGSYPDYLFFEMGLLGVKLNLQDIALQYLEKAIKQSRKNHLKDFLQHPSLDPLRLNPKFQDLLKL